MTDTRARATGLMRERKRHMASSAARERVRQARAEELAQEKKKADRRRHLITYVFVPLGVLIVAAIVLAVMAALPHNTSSPTAAGSASAASVQAKVTSVPASALDTAGADHASIVPQAISAPALTTNGKPQITYIGAEYCPFCATERWPLVIALSRFGTFHNLGLTSSDSTDVYPNTATLSFQGSSYTSKYVSFTGKEIENRAGQPLDKLTPAEQKLFQTYDSAPYVQSSGSIPFVDLGGTYLISGASYDPQVLQGKTHMQIADAAHDPTSTIGAPMDSVANVITAGICKLTGGQPATVCTSPGVTAGAARLKK